MSAGDESPTAARYRRLAGLGDRFEAAWRSCQDPRVEDFLEGLDGPEREMFRRHLSAVEADLRRKAGSSSDEDPLGSLGDFDLLGEIGRGGMGIVYRAWQRGIGRVVAVKVIRPELGDDLTVAEFEALVTRFRTEARAAGSIHHENIVEVFDVGEDSGRYFYAMRLVEGRDLAGVALDGPMTGREAASILKVVALAVARAHDQGVLHRDLKPRNILIDKSGRPFVTDFGLAKILQDAQPGLTRQGEVLGSPSYMPPEQIRDPGSVGPAGDVYAIGATLYELIAGRPPFRAAEALETLRQVKEMDPPRPRDLDRAIDRDLETICLKCLEKDPDRRYASALGLAEDLRRYLEGEPILARPVGPWGRARRWSRRRPALAAVGALAVAATMTVMALIAAFAWSEARAADRLRAEKAATDRQRVRAEANFRRARQSVRDYFVEVSQSEELLKAPRGLQELRRKLLERALTYYEEFIRESGDVEELRSEAAEAQYEAAKVIDQIGRRDDAIRGYTLARDRYDALVLARPDALEPRRLQALSNHDLGNALAAVGRTEEALLALRQSLAESEGLARLDPKEPDDRGDSLRTRARIAELLGDSGRLEAALNDFVGILRDQEGLVRDQPDSGVLHYYLGRMLVNYANLLRKVGRREEAERSYRRAIDVFREASNRMRGNLAVRRHLAVAYNNLAIMSQETSRPKEAIASYDRAREALQELVRTQPAVPKYRSDLAGVYNNLGLLQAAEGRTTEAMAAYEAALAIHERLTSDDPDTIEYRSDLTASQLNLGVFLASIKQYDRAIEFYSKALASFESLAREFAQSVEYRLSVAGTLQNIGDAKREAGRPGESILDYQRASEVMEPLLKEHPKFLAYEAVMGDIQAGLGIALSATGRHADAVDALDRAIRHQTIAFRLAPEVTQYWRNLGASYDARSAALYALGRHQEARASIQLHEEIARDDPEERFRIACQWARIKAPDAAMRAIAHLRSSVDGGFRDRDRFHDAEELSNLREIPEFQMIRSDLHFPTDPFSPG